MTARTRSGDRDAPGQALSVLVDRLRALPQSRLQRQAAPAHAFAQWLADAGAGVEGRCDDTPPPSRPVPSVGIFAVGDQVAVTANDLIAAATGLPPEEPVWSEGVRRALGSVLTEARTRADTLRAVL